MSLTDTRTQVVAIAVVALTLFAVAFFVARAGSSDAAPAGAREQPLPAAATAGRAPLRSIGAVPALPRAAPRPTPAPRPAIAAPPAAARPAPAPQPAAPAPPPPPPAQRCVGELCP